MTHRERLVQAIDELKIEKKGYEDELREETSQIMIDRLKELIFEADYQIELHKQIGVNLKNKGVIDNGM